MIAKMTIAAALIGLALPAYANNNGHNSIAGCYFEVGKECKETGCSDADLDWGYDQCDMAYAAADAEKEEFGNPFGVLAPMTWGVGPGPSRPMGPSRFGRR